MKNSKPDTLRKAAAPKQYQSILMLRKFWGRKWKMEMRVISSFHVTSLFLYPTKTSENLWFSDFLRGGIERDKWHEIYLVVLSGIYATTH